jgi:hypothetical protein
LTYSWSLTTVPSGSTASLNDPTINSPSFVADLAGEYVATLVVNDGKVDSAPDAVSIYVCPPWDVNCDGTVDIFDVIQIGFHWSEAGGPGSIREDVNADGFVDIFDVILVGFHWD